MTALEQREGEPIAEGQELAAEQRAEAEAEFNLRRESDRLINERWKMEDLERAGR